MFSNHMMQLLSLTAMEAPVSLHADAVRNEQAKVLRAVQPLDAEDVLHRSVRGQYGEGAIANKGVPAYRAEPGVSPESRTETFVALQVNIDNWRWAGVPFYLRTGKRLPSKSSQIVIQFRDVPYSIFGPDDVTANRLVIRLQPEEEVSLTLMNKTPALEGMELRPV